MPIISSGGSGGSVTATTFTNVSGGVDNAISVNARCVVASTFRTSMSGEKVMRFTDATEWNIEDLKQSIANLVLDGTSVGHFEGSDGTPISLGEGKVNPLIVRYLKVSLSGGDVYISAISGDGTASGSITFEDYDGDPLGAPTGTYPVLGIYGLEIEDDILMSVKHGDVYEKEYTNLTGGTNISNKHMRIVLPNLSGGTAIRFTLSGEADIRAISFAERKLLETLDDWTFLNATPSDDFCPKKQISFDDDSYALYCWTNSQPSIVYQNVDGLTESDTYSLSFNGYSHEGSNATVLIGTQDGEDYKWFNFTGENIGTYTSGASPSSDQIQAITLQHELCGYSVDSIIIPSTGSVDVYIGTVDGYVTIDDVEFKKEGGDNTLSNSSFENWTKVSGTADTLSGYEDIYFLGNEDYELNGEVTTDWLPETIKPDTEYLLLIDFGSSTSTLNSVAASDGEGVYISNSNAEACHDSNAPTSTLTDNTMAFITKIEVGDFKYPEVITTAIGTEEVIYSSTTEIDAINMSGGGDGGVIISFDNGSTWKAWANGNGFVTLASNLNSVHGGQEGFWYYASSWVEGEGVTAFTPCPLSANTANAAATYSIYALMESGAFEGGGEEETEPDYSSDFVPGTPVLVGLVAVSSEDEGVVASKITSEALFDITMTATPSLPGGGEESKNEFYLLTFDPGSETKNWLLFHNWEEPISEIIIYTI